MFNFFLSLEKRNANRNTIQSLSENGRLITKKDEILKQFSDNLQTKYKKT